MLPRQTLDQYVEEAVDRTMSRKSFFAKFRQLEQTSQSDCVANGSGGQQVCMCCTRPVRHGNLGYSLRVFSKTIAFPDVHY